MITIAYVNFWQEEHENIYFTKFIKENIDNDVQIVDKNDIPDILLCSVFGNVLDIVKIKAKCKIFFYGENLNFYSEYNNQEILNLVFDLNIGFKKTDLSNNNVRFPLWLTFYDYYNYDENDNILKYIENSYENNKNNNTKFATLIAKHKGFNNVRDILSSELEKYGEVLYPSNYKNNTEKIDEGNGPHSNLKNNKIKYLSDFDYNICPENSDFELYCTEKIFEAFEGGCIPIYWGNSLPEVDIISRNKYFFYKSINAEIKDVIENKQNYLDGKLFVDGADKVIQNYYNTLINCIQKLLKVKNEVKL